MNDFPPVTCSPLGEQVASLKHSGLGIASFVISLATGLLETILVVAAGYLQMSTPGGLDQSSPTAVVLGLAILGGLAVCLLGAGLGIGGLCQKQRIRIFAILGLVFNLLVVFGMVGLILFGLVTQQQ